MSKKLNTQSTQVVEPKADEKPIESVPTESDVNPIAARIAGLSQEQQDKIAFFQSVLPMFHSHKVLNDQFKAFAQETGLYETSANTEEIAKQKALFDASLKALLGTGMTEDNPLVVQFKKGYTSTIEKLEKDVKDNLRELATYFGIVLAKSQGSRVYASTGQLTATKMSETEIKAHDFVYSEHDRKAIVVHSQTVSESALTKLGVKSASDLWLAFEFNGTLQYERAKNPETNWHYANITNMPESWVKVHSVVCTSGTISGLIGVVAATVGNKYSGNGWQGNAYLSDKAGSPVKFDKVQRVVKES